MNGEQSHGEQHHGARLGGGQCLCCLAMDMFLQLAVFRSEEARAHFRNSRVEFLKGIRSLLDERIESLSRTPQRGSSIKME